MKDTSESAAVTMFGREFQVSVQWKTRLEKLVFLARDSIYAIARYMPSPVRLSVWPSVRDTGGSVKDG